MKVLWIVNTMFPDVCAMKNLPITAVGGWMYGSAKKISEKKEFDLVVVCTHRGKKIEFYKINGITYYLIPSSNNETYNEKLEEFWDEISTIENPDVVHIHGTEYAHGLSAMNIFDRNKFVISIQGLVSVCARYYLAGISPSTISHYKSFRDVIKGNIISDQKKFYKKGDLEKKYIQSTYHVMGRTTWDFAHTKAINPSVNYHHCGETLRSKFYDADKWNIKSMIPYTIFLSQASYPIKGLHQLLQAVNLLKIEFPNLKVRVGGTEIYKSKKSLKEKLKISGYALYIKYLIKKFNLEDRINFLGMLSEEQMIKEYKNAHLFICPSSIENSPNSIGEAQIIGTPVIASYVGGVPDMIIHQQTGLLYRFEEIEMLAMHISDVFINNENALTLSKNGIIVSEQRHNVENIVLQMCTTYYNIASNKL